MAIIFDEQGNPIKGANPFPVGITGSDISDGSVVTGASFELDESDYPVLRVVDANPEAYNATDDTKQVQPVYPGWSSASKGADNAAVTITKAAEAGKSHYITGVIAGFAHATAVAEWNIQSPAGTVILRGVSGLPASGFVVKCPENTQATFALNAGGAGTFGIATLLGFTV